MFYLIWAILFIIRLYILVANAPNKLLFWSFRFLSILTVYFIFYELQVFILFLFFYGFKIINSIVILF